MIPPSVGDEDSFEIIIDEKPADNITAPDLTRQEIVRPTTLFVT
jgi:hypothetical protein